MRLVTPGGWRLSPRLTRLSKPPLSLVMAGTKRPTDINQRAKMIVDIATGEIREGLVDDKNPAAGAGRPGGLKGGNARAMALTTKRRSEIAKRAAEIRWGIK